MMIFVCLNVYNYDSFMASTGVLNRNNVVVSETAFMPGQAMTADLGKGSRLVPLCWFSLDESYGPDW